MNTFNNIKELLSALKREEKLISEMFTKRKALDYKFNYALDVVDNEEDRIKYLIERSVLRENGNYIEIDDLYIEFFEQVLDINEEINLSYINENIKIIKENILYYFNENNEQRKYGYLKGIKKTLRKIGIITLKSVIDLRRNVDNTFKNEANYTNKQLKLENLDTKRTIIKSLIKQTLLLINEEELTFFNTATDEELYQTIINLKYNLRESSHNLIEIEKQIIDYLNQIKLQGKFIEKIRKLKYLKDQFLIESETNLKNILSTKTDVVFEKRSFEPLKLSIDFLREDENVFSIIKKVAKKHLDRKQFKPILADNISNEFLTNSVEEEIMVNLEEVKNHFIATSDNLFNFIINYDFSKEISFDERVTFFCQIASQYETELIIENRFEQKESVEFALIYPK